MTIGGKERRRYSMMRKGGKKDDEAGGNSDNEEDGMEEIGRWRIVSRSHVQSISITRVQLMLYVTFC